MQTTEVSRVIEDLVETLEDGKKGFAEAAERLADAGRIDLADKFREYSSQREQFSAELRELSASPGDFIEETGSVGGTVHRAWINFKDAVSMDSAEAILGAAETGEDHAVNEYNDALEQDLTSDVRAVVARQAQAIQAAHDEVRNLRDRESS